MKQISDSQIQRVREIIGEGIYPNVKFGIIANLVTELQQLQPVKEQEDDERQD